jgi:hypothetical protein
LPLCRGPPQPLTIRWPAHGKMERKRWTGWKPLTAVAADTCPGQSGEAAHRPWGRRNPSGRPVPSAFSPKTGKEGGRTRTCMTALAVRCCRPASCGHVQGIKLKRRVRRSGLAAFPAVRPQPCSARSGDTTSKAGREEERYRNRRVELRAKLPPFPTCKKRCIGLKGVTYVCSNAENHEGAAAADRTAIWSVVGV